MFVSVRDLDLIRAEIAALSLQLRRRSQEISQPLVQSPIDIINEPDSENAQRLTDIENRLSEVLNHLQGIDQELTAARNQMGARNEQITRICDENLDLRNEIVQIKEELQQLRNADNQMAIADAFYARTLGAVLGGNIESLQAGNFEQVSRQVGDRLNQFFQLEVPHGDVLQSLLLCAQSVSVALKEVAVQMSRINARASGEIDSHLQRAAALAAELGGLQVQLQNRRATIETKLSIPVSIHVGARQTFLDQLGRGIRHEIDKLSEPQSYFANEWKRLVTNDIVSVVDVCDSIAHPGTRPELESALDLLFMHAGLQSILPRPGEPLRLGEHGIVKTQSGGKGKSKSIAQVVKRGFYYRQSGDEALLRKSGVVVYR